MFPPALKPDDVINFLEDVFSQAKELSNAYKPSISTRTPFVTVYKLNVYFYCTHVRFVYCSIYYHHTECMIM